MAINAINLASLKKVCRWGRWRYSVFKNLAVNIVWPLERSVTSATDIVNYPVPKK